MMRYISDASLQELWSSGQSTGLTELERLKYLSVLFKMSGATGSLEQVRASLEEMSSGSPVAGAIALHLDKMNHA
jgi:hypothetical protein